MKYVIIGNSAAAVGAVEGIRQVDKNGEITIITNEPHHTYSRPLISYLLLGKATEESMKYRPDSFYEDNGCKVIYASVEKIVAECKTVYYKPIADLLSTTPNSSLLTPNSSTPNCLSYDKLLVATGSAPFVPPFEGLDTVKDKFTFMSLDDAKALGGVLSPDKNVLIIGAGLIGLKCAEGISGKVKNITVIDLAPRILSSILDDNGAGFVQNHLESKGIEFKLSCSVKEFVNNTVITDSGEQIDFDILLLAVGVRPNTALLKDIVNIDRAIVINEKSETSVRDIYAAGDCTQTLDVSSGQNKIMALLPNAYMQGECAGVNMAGGEKCFDKAIPMNAIGFFCGGLPTLHIITAGNYTGDEYCDIGTDFYKCLFYSNNRLNGYILIGNVDKAGIYTSLIREQTPLDTIDFELICEKPGLMAFTKEDRVSKLGGEPK